MDTDYLGNKIKAGQEICFITVIEKPVFCRYMPFVPVESDDEESEIKEDKHCWKVGDYYKVRYHVGFGLFYVLQSGESKLYATLETEMVFNKTETNILAIKGISDNEEMYLNSLLF